MRALPAAALVLVVAILVGCGSGGSTTAQSRTQRGAETTADTGKGADHGGAATAGRGGEVKAQSDPAGGRPRRASHRRHAERTGSGQPAEKPSPRSKRSPSPKESKSSEPSTEKNQASTEAKEDQVAEKVKELLPGHQKTANGGSGQSEAASGGEEEPSASELPTEILEPSGGGGESGGQGGGGGVEAVLEGLTGGGN